MFEVFFANLSSLLLAFLSTLIVYLCFYFVFVCTRRSVSHVSHECTGRCQETYQMNYCLFLFSTMCLYFQEEMSVVFLMVAAAGLVCHGWESSGTEVQPQLELPPADSNSDCWHFYGNYFDMFINDIFC